MKRVLVTTAGTGSRIGLPLNKGMLSIGDKPVLSHIIEKFPKDIEFVISLGYGGSLLRQFLELTYPDRTFIFVEVVPFTGSGSSPTHSILSCKEYLQCPFVFITNDTIVTEEIPLNEENWIGVSDDGDLEPSQYRTVCVDESKIKLLEKEPYPSSSCKPYIGLAGIYDFESFWRGMEAAKDVSCGESNGLRSLIQCCDVTVKTFTWHDTGNLTALKNTKKQLGKQTYSVIDKYNECIWFTEGHAIKYHEDPQFISCRVQRASHFGKFIPKIVGITENLYKYKLVSGRPLTSCINPLRLKRLLRFLEEMWRLPCEEKLKKSHVNHFIYGKTIDRLATLSGRFPFVESINVVNGVLCDTAADLIKYGTCRSFQSRWSVFAHGDLHLDNVIVDDDEGFHLVDWRQGFGKTLNRFDIHYELAKLYQSLLISYNDILNKNYLVHIEGDKSYFSFSSSIELMLCQNTLREYVLSRGLDWYRVVQFTGYIFLSNAPLQIDDDYAQLNYLLGRYLLEVNK